VPPGAAHLAHPRGLPAHSNRHLRLGSGPPSANALTPYLKERCIWRHEFETLDQAREVVAAYIDSYHHRPDSGLDYRTPKEARETWDDAQDGLQRAAA
jgi:putative transposase